MFKQCRQCKEWDLITGFGIDQKTKDGFNKRCRKCKREYDRQRRLTPKERYREIKKDAVKRNIPFTLDLADIERLWQAPCYYCLDLIATVGIDRKDSSHGYIASNIVPCCPTCNTMKLTLSESEWLAKMERILRRFGLIM